MLYTLLAIVWVQADSDNVKVFNRNSKVKSKSAQDKIRFKMLFTRHGETHGMW